jgi:hypothetical protein
VGIQSGEHHSACLCSRRHQRSHTKVALLEDDLSAERRAWEAPKREHRAQIEELTLLQTRGSELCPAINSPPQGKHHLSEGMRLATLRHTEMVRELAAFWEAVSSVAESVLRCSLGDIARAEVVGELVIKFQQV